ncbi:hypothetical protein O181_127164 [Austropuccinia psidii MF-1]|uniref:GH18 domain-containing protein n=1 Tax=Austropuccinia psidii MF-1 TaxID=1389203 RepID=A0A9Q3Q6X1_9BASI|nr:hypothetical protein [Austropuccinia psidii MF-1]
MGYYPSYNYKDQKPTDINFSLYTNALFFVAVPKHNFTLNFGDLKNEIAERLMFDFVKQAKEANVTTCLSVGGWTGSQHLSFLTSIPENRFIVIMLSARPQQREFLPKRLLNRLKDRLILASCRSHSTM